MKKKVSAILSHLLSNAIKFTNYGVIEIGCKATTLSLYVEDSGIGIDAKKIDVIFERFSKPMIQAGIMRVPDWDCIFLNVTSIYWW
jgi:signal transduction histidine kinase